MKLEIRKLEDGRIGIKFTHDTAKKPAIVELDRSRVDLVIELLKNAKNADSFRFELEL